ncbi:MAG: hypothetical protein RIF41_05395 [Polyangiaceae bacterium]
MRVLAILVLLGGALAIADVAAASHPVDGGDDAAPAGACVAFGESCEPGQKCCDAAGSFGVCNKFGQGSRCTIACPSDPKACPNEGRGCNHQSPPMCRSPRRGGGGQDRNK